MSSNLEDVGSIIVNLKVRTPKIKWRDYFLAHGGLKNIPQYKFVDLLFKKTVSVDL